MSKRLQVVLSDAQYREVAGVARRQRMTISTWVRGLLHSACRRAPRHPADAKLAAIRAAFEHRFPTADLDQMLQEIEAGYGRAES